MEKKAYYTHQLFENENNYDVPTNPLKWDEKVSDDKIDTFVLMEGQQLMKFARTYMVKDKHLINRIPSAHIKLYKFPYAESDVIVCTSMCSDIKVFGEACYLLEDYFKNAKLCIGFQTVPSVMYKTSVNLNDDSLLKGIYTKKCPIKIPTIEPLELPNFATGIAAGMYNRCDFNERPAGVFVSYISKDLYGFDSDKAKKISQILNAYNVPTTEKVKSQAVFASNIYT